LHCAVGDSLRDEIEKMDLDGWDGVGKLFFIYMHAVIVGDKED
jgi:hypothetical protein